MNRRRASSLIELIICISIGSSLMLLSIGVAHQAMLLSSRARERADVSRTSVRLAQQFRSDVHRASEVDLVDSASIRFEIATGATVTYKASGTHITRELARESGETEQEQFSLGDESLIGFAKLEDPGRAELVVHRETHLQNEAPRLEVHVAAVIGKLSRAERAEQKADESAGGEQP